MEMYVSSIATLERDLQKQQQEFDEQQGERDREWMDKRDREPQMFENVQEHAKVHQGKMAEHMKKHSQRLAHESITFMAELFKRMDK